MIQRCLSIFVCLFTSLDLTDPYHVRYFTILIDSLNELPNPVSYPSIVCFTNRIICTERRYKNSAYKFIASSAGWEKVSSFLARHEDSFQKHRKTLLQQPKVDKITEGAISSMWRHILTMNNCFRYCWCLHIQIFSN